MNNENLKCPFCGGHDIRFTNHGRTSYRKEDEWSTCCYDCGATFTNCSSRDALVRKWQRRPAPVKDGDFAANLRKARLTKQWGQKELSDASKLPTTQISNFECGQREPSLKNLRRLRTALKCDWGDLLD